MYNIWQDALVLRTPWSSLVALELRSRINTSFDYLKQLSSVPNIIMYNQWFDWEMVL